MKERRFKHWAWLNEEGMKIFGDVFPDKKVPVLSMIPQWVYLPIGNKTIYKVYFEEVTDEQIEKIINILVEKQGGPREDLEKQIKEYGLPLREELTSGSGTNHPGLFY